MYVSTGTDKVVFELTYSPNGIKRTGNLYAVS